MPKKDTIVVGSLHEPAVNIHFKVGIGGDNGPADVMLIQTLFHYLGHVKGKPMQYLGFPLHEIPAITGDCCWKTKQAIVKFQRRHAKKLISADGLIHPAVYEGRSIKPGEQRVMTITLLHFFATEMSVYHPEPHYIDGLIKMLPRLRTWLT